MIGVGTKALRHAGTKGRKDRKLGVRRDQRRQQPARATLQQARRDTAAAVFETILKETAASELRFEWFVTRTERAVLPILAEARLLQAFFEDQRKLPKYNVCA